MERIHLQGGQPVRLQYQDGMWRCHIAGKNFCGETLENLVRAIAYLNPVITPEIPLPADERSHAEQLIAILRNPKSYLSEKQDSLERLLRHAAEGDEEALSIVSELENKPRPTREALNLTGILNKVDFAFVTHEEMVEHVNNLVLRSRLMGELANRLIF